MNVNLDSLYQIIIVLEGWLESIAEGFISTIPNGLVFLMLMLFGASTWALSKKVKQLHIIAADMKVIADVQLKQTNHWKSIAKSFEEELDKLKAMADSNETKQ